MSQPVFQFEGHEGEKFAFVNRDEMFYNSSLLFIEYDDIIKSIPFTVLSYISQCPEIISKICDMSLIEGYGIEALYEFYIHRKFPNIFREFLLDEYKDISDEKLYTLYFNFFDSAYDEILSNTFELNFVNVLRTAINKNPRMFKKCIIWTPVYHDIYKNDIDNLFGSSVIYKAGNLTDVLKDESKDATYIFSDITHINDINNMNRVSMASFVIPKEYDYNFKNNEPKVDIAKLSSEHSMKFDYFYAIAD